MPIQASVSVVIPTMAAKERELPLRRAIESIRRSSTTKIRIIAVVNGTRSDPEICRWLSAQPDIHCEYISAASAPLAVRRGRELVQTPFFSFLDDDDEYLSGGTDLKRAAFTNSAGTDLVISSGFWNIGGIDEPILTSLDHIPSTPLECLFEYNWLYSCNALFRSDSILPEFFADPHPYGEWTWLAYKLGLAGKKIAVINQATFRINDTPGSLSKSDSYYSAYQALYRRMMALAPPAEIARTIRVRMSADWHDQSDRALLRGERLQAFSLHLKSLTLPGGLKYLPYTRRLLPLWPST